MLLTALFGLYIATASSHVLGEDNGEFCALYAAGGVAHPSGYPLYTTLLRAFAWLPVTTPARGAALVTVAIGLAAVALLYMACRAWGAGTAAAALASALYGTAPLAWDLATKAEVFALNAALAASIVLVAAPHGPFRGMRRAAVLGLLFGLGLSNHHSVVFLAPLGVAGLCAAFAETARRVRALFAVVVGGVLGLSPYATLPFAASGAGWVWGDVTTLHGVVAHFLRRDYGTTSLALGPAHPSIAANLGALTRTLVEDSRGFALVGLWVLTVALVRVVRPAKGARPVALAALAASFVLAGPLFATRMNVELSPEGAAIVRRFHLLPLLLLAVPFAVGVEPLLARVRAPLQGAIVATAVVAGAVLGFGRVQDERGPMLERYIVDLLETAPENAVVLGSGDLRVFGVLYAQLGLGLRRDVVFVSPALLHHDWYRRRIETALGFALPPASAGSIDTVALAERLLDAGRPVLLSDLFTPAISKTLPTYPLGVLVAVLPRGAFPPSPSSLEGRNLAVFAAYHVDPKLLDEERAWTRGARDAYRRPWTVLGAAYRAAGDTESATRNERRATLEPWVTREE
ncbi:MAG TPA: DUF2723 domain-containing protein [Polyangiaceae bacterium]|nr:DUF2723 domain-containing protein [Polyangiaceae bacterium]